MEVHHPHHVTHKKKWGEYLLEFFMLFLAVFLGFVAENIREDVVEQHREKQFMQSLIKDLQLDTAYANLCLQSINSRMLSIDSTLDYFMAHQKVTRVPLSTIRQMKRSTWDQVFLEHTGTIDQLKYSGGLRLIQNRQIVDSIESYYQQINRYTLSRLAYRNNQDFVFSLGEKILDAFDNARFYQHKINLNDSSTMAINNTYLNEYLNLLLRLKNSANNDKNNYNIVKSRANNVIALISKQYNIEDE